MCLHLLLFSLPYTTFIRLCFIRYKTLVLMVGFSVSLLLYCAGCLCVDYLLCDWFFYFYDLNWTPYGVSMCAKLESRLAFVHVFQLHIPGLPVVFRRLNAFIRSMRIDHLDSYLSLSFSHVWCFYYLCESFKLLSQTNASQHSDCTYGFNSFLVLSVESSRRDLAVKMES